MERVTDPVRVGVLSLHNSKETKAILNAVADLGHEPVWLREENVSFRTAGTDAAPSPDVDVVVNRLLLSKSDRPIEDLSIATAYDAIRPVLNPPDPTLRAVHKYATALTLATSDVPVPESRFALDRETLADLRAEFDDPPVQKAAIGTNGSDVWRADAEESIVPTLGDRRTILQRFLDGRDHPSDVRAYVVGGDVVGAMRRYAPEGDWRANIARGGEPEDVTDELPVAAADLARTATATLGLDYAGVDLIRADGEWHVLEVNPTAGFKGLFEATGTSVAPAIAKLAVEYAGGDVDDDRVVEVSDTLDDSVPDCKPPLGNESIDQSTIGYTEEVVVRGTDSFETVVAKSDTGARRTSIDLGLAGEIEAGPIKSKTAVKSGSKKSSTTRPLVDVEIGIHSQCQTVTASVEDRDHMEYPLLLGRDVLEGNRIDLQRRAVEE